MIEFLFVLLLLITIISGIFFLEGSFYGGRVFLTSMLIWMLFIIWSIFDLFWQLAEALMQ